QIRVLVGARIRGRIRLAVPARVVRDRPVAGAREGVRAHHHVAPYGREPVQQDNRVAVALGLAPEHDLAAPDLERTGPGSSRHGVTCKRKRFRYTARNNRWDGTE